ncbi:uncharacterized protein LOC106472167 isoform X1 [Limulus polyphemus]|uniref:Uncharacterized protein LOC106472167 isoform X1 n=1 Tax=Limulus polyphemus TaxID=6850 RepID=A0ABM1TKS2_LIMPO|nr:uncharacterized protein LOC106472167 isoform X1 [Limulus polyphemus]
MGLEAGTHYIGEQAVEIEGHRAIIAGTSTLCGSIATMDMCVRYFKNATVNILLTLKKMVITRGSYSKTKRSSTEDLEVVPLQNKGLLLVCPLLILQQILLMTYLCLSLKGNCTRHRVYYRISWSLNCESSDKPPNQKLDKIKLKIQKYDLYFSFKTFILKL